MLVPFEKWHGCKNDFIVVWLEPQAKEVFQSLQKRASQICARDGAGVGADGILVLHQDSRNDLQPATMTIINKDGSLAANCCLLYTSDAADE